MRLTPDPVPDHGMSLGLNLGPALMSNPTPYAQQNADAGSANDTCDVCDTCGVSDEDDMHDALPPLLRAEEQDDAVYNLLYP